MVRNTLYAAVLPALCYAQSIPLQSLKGVPVPEPPDLARYVTNRAAAVAMGKALFWDVQLSSDGKVACATCHFHAGSDMRLSNQISPGLNRAGVSNFSFSATRTGSVSGPNFKAKPGDFPFYVLSSPTDRESSVLFSTPDVMASHGVFLRDFTSATPGASEDACVDRADPIFTANAANTRRAGSRNAPTVINAVFNHRNFQDGRASNVFNGADPFGARSPNAVVYLGNPATATRIQLINASLASQAVSPPVNNTEMSCSQRTWPEIGRRLLKAIALKNQSVAIDDSALAAWDSANGARGLRASYEQLMKEAFAQDLWSATNAITVNGKTYTQAEANFSLFFGLAVQMYEATLISDDAPIDRYFAAYPSTAVADANALTQEQRDGLGVFLGTGRCATCHGGPQLTNAGTPANLRAPSTLAETMTGGNGLPGLYDFGFYNIGVRPTSHDLGLGGRDPWGNPLSFARPLAASSGGRDIVDGAFKTPNLRNLSLTGPYFHDGSRRTIEEVVEFYKRGGDRRGSITADTTGFGANPSNLAPNMTELSLAPFEIAALVAFLKTALTDERVRWERAPFDHPELPLVEARESVLVPAVGRNGRSGNPLRSFEEISAAGTLGYSAAGLGNLALNRAATQSSTGWNGVAARAVDGITNGNFFAGSVSHTTLDLQPYWQVDLGASANLTEIVLFNRTDCCANRLSGFRVFVSDTPFSGRYAFQLKAQPGVSTIDHPGTAGATLRLPVNRRGRYIRVQ